jgi:8-oxo-dGTP pyrophosphatase MutT (NUDIX family)
MMSPGRTGPQAVGAGQPSAAPPAELAAARPAQSAAARPADFAPARPAATLLLLRDGTAGLEVFMVLRNRQIEFASGALVFPGGRVEASDAAIGKTLAPADDLASFRVAALREAFEECGVLLARGADGAHVPPATAARLVAGQRAALCSGELDFATLLGAAGLVADLAALTDFAHWVTPVDLAKRFDT